MFQHLSLCFNQTVAPWAPPVVLRTSCSALPTLIITIHTPKKLRDGKIAFGNCFKFASPPASHRSLSGPPGPKSPKSQKKVSWGLRPRGPKKSGKSLEKVPNRHFRDFFQTFRTYSRLFPDFSGPRGRRPRETSFQSFWGFRARRARETPVARGRACNFKSCDA